MRHAIQSFIRQNIMIVESIKLSIVFEFKKKETFQIIHPE